jgi:tetratricopeptide (TPR) repeat protein
VTAVVTTLLLALNLGLAPGVPAQPDDNPLAITDAMKQFLAENVPADADRQRQLQNLVRVVFLENALHFTYSTETRTAAETFEQRSGNCVSYTFLLIAMARHLGFDARLREVDIAPTWSRTGNVVSMFGHVNVGVFIGNDAYVVDLFPQVNRIMLGGRVVSDERALAHFYSNKGTIALIGGRWDEAIELLHRALSSDPTLPCGWANLGVTYSQSGKLALAEQSYKKSLELRPDDQSVMSNLSSLYARMGRDREARIWHERARKFLLRNPYFHFDEGAQAAEAGDYRRAIEQYRAALRLKPNEHNFQLAMAKAYVRLGDMGEAEKWLRSALKNAPDDSSRRLYSEKLSLLATRPMGS